MNIRTITITSAAKLPHPNADFASISSGIEIQATLADDDQPAACAKRLQALADNLVEQHLASTAERMRQRSSSAKPQAATENKAAELAAKYGGK